MFDIKCNCFVECRLIVLAYACSVSKSIQHADFHL